MPLASLSRPLATICAFAWFLHTEAAPPTYDHVVVVIEENHSFTQIIGNRVSAPYINALADGGVSFTNFYAVTHPSQPNYLEFFSGDAQGVTDDNLPANYPFSTPNLGAELIAAGVTFAGYSEDLPAAGDATTTSTNITIGGVTFKLYRRKHNPWANWQDATLPTPANRLPPSTNLRWLDFPADFTQLPQVSIVVPNEQNDMHDGTVKMGDDWLAANLSAYAEWAKTHNSLLVVIWDEDNFTGSNRIPAIFHGAGLLPGRNNGLWTLHNLLRTIEEMFGAAHAGSAAQVRAITGVFANEPVASVARFQQGLGGYAGTHDTHIRQDAPDDSFGATTPLVVDLDDNAAAGNQPVQALARFDDLIGHAPGQIPPGAPILSAKLVLTTGTGTNDPTTTPVEVHRMLASWDETSTWNSLGDGLAADDVEAAAAPDFTLTPRNSGLPAIFDVTTTVQAWMSGAPNRGWAVLPANTDGWRWNSAETASAAARPALEITFAASVLEFSAASYGVNENAGTAMIVVTRRGSPNSAVTVDYATSDGTAIADVDYTTSGGTLSWPADDTAPRSFTVPILAHAGADGIETVNLTLSNPTGVAVLNAASAATLLITETPIEAWRVAKFGANATAPLAADSADPDGDGVTNFLEYAFGSEPLANASRGAAQLTPGDHLALSFTRLAAATDLTFTVQVSGDVQTWFDGSIYSAAGSVPSNAYTTEISHTSGAVETILVQDNTAVGDAAARYLRLRVTRP